MHSPHSGPVRNANSSHWDFLCVIVLISVGGGVSDPGSSGSPIKCCRGVSVHHQFDRGTGGRLRGESRALCTQRPTPTEHPDACRRRAAGGQAQEGVKPEAEPAGRAPGAVHAGSPRGNAVGAGTPGLRTRVSVEQDPPPRLEGSCCLIRQVAIRATARVCRWHRLCRCGCGCHPCCTTPRLFL